MNKSHWSQTIQIWQLAQFLLQDYLRNATNFNYIQISQNSIFIDAMSFNKNLKHFLKIIEAENKLTFKHDRFFESVLADSLVFKTIVTLQGKTYKKQTR